MGIKLSAEAVSPAPSVAQRLRAGFLLVLGGLLAVLQKAVLPHLLLALGLLAATGYALYHQLQQSAGWLVAAVLPATLLIGGILALGYAFLTALLYSLKSAASYAEDFFYELFEALKDKIRKKIDNWEDGIAKQQAKVIVENSVREVLAPLKQLRVGSVPKVLLTILVGVLTFISRSVFLARVARATGTTIRFSRIFASRATLVGALFLNMRWLAALLLWMLYIAGGLVFILDLWWIC